MIRIHTCSDSLLINHYRNLLEQAGIRCFIKSTYLSGAMGELPPGECWPELWIEDEAREAEARQLIEHSNSDGNTDGWQCQCGEQHEQQFSICWRCGTERKESL